MKYIPICLLFFIILIQGCTPPTTYPEADLVIATANILFKNTESSSTIASALMATGADIIVINEALEGINVTQAEYNLGGYSTHYLEATISGFSILVATKIGGTSGEIPLTHISPEGAEIYGPHSTLRINVKGTNISIIGAHIPTDFHFPPAHRKNSFQAINEMIGQGEIVQEKGSCRLGDLPIMTGDFNTLPTEQYLVDLYKAGLRDAFSTNPDYYDLTWGFEGVPLLARIDYVLLSYKLTPLYQDVFDIPGSDHQGVIAGINIP